VIEIGRFTWFRKWSYRCSEVVLEGFKVAEWIFSVEGFFDFG